MISDALGSELVSRTVGYKLTTGDFSESTPNLPQRVALLGEANTANQLTYPTDPLQITSAKVAGDNYGYGSPIHMMAKILFPTYGGGIGGIPVIVYPQAEAGAGVAKKIELTVTGIVTVASVRHNVVIAGRKSVDGESYGFDVNLGDSVSTIATAISTAINQIDGCPFSASVAIGVVTLTSKWAGETSNSLTVSVDTNDEDGGITYAAVSTVSGSAVPTVTTSLDLFGNEWNTLVLNGYSMNDDVITELEAFNGKPDPVTPTGRYQAQIMKPFIALCGSVLEENGSYAHGRKDEVTVAICPAPLSAGMPFEAAANMAVLQARIAQDTPHLDVSGRSYADMPTPLAIGEMANYADRQALVLKGNSTVDLVNGAYQIQDFITTYHPVGETVPQFRYVRNLTIDFNVKYSYFLLEQLYVVDHSIASDNDTVNVTNVIKPKTWKAVLYDLADDLALRNIIVEPSFFKESIITGLSNSNPDRIETFFRYKRSAFVRLAATTAQAGFNFGSN